MRSNLVISFAEALEKSLLHAEIGAWRTGGVGFEGSVHAFMGAILLWTTRSDALVGDAELKPPNVKVSQTVNACGSEGGAVVAADRVGEAMLSKQAQELVLDASCLHIRQAMATKQVAAEVVDDGERVAGSAVAHEELPFEIDGPNLVGRVVKGAAPGCFHRR